MTSELMIQYMQWLRQFIDSDRPIIYFFDNHKSHMSIDLATLCRENRIITIGLYPNATSIIQPLDVGLFGELKRQFKTSMESWKSQSLNKGQSFDVVDLAPLIKEITDFIATLEVIQKAFQKCGLFPWNVRNVNFSRCLGKNFLPAHKVT